MDVDQHMSRVPDYTAFPTVDQMHAELDEIAAAHPDLVRLRRIGTSRLGEPLRVATVGSGPHDAVIIGGPHPNEPIGSLTVSSLLRQLVEDASLREDFGYRWHLIPCVDPDGARLNEGWYARPSDRRAYAEHFYRPAETDQVEWTFPLTGEDYFFDRTLPETEALMRLMDEVKPTFVYSLHNGELQGAFYYLSKDEPALAERLAAIATAQGLPLHMGPPEVPSAVQIGPAAYRSPRGADIAATYEIGGGSVDYAERFDALHLVTELPYWADPRVADETPTDQQYGETIQANLAAQRALIAELTRSMAAVRADLTVHSPFRRAVQDFLDNHDGFISEWESFPGTDRPATVAEAVGNQQMVHTMRLRYGGMYLRLLDAELAAGNLTPAIRAEHTRVKALFDAWFAEAEADATATPIPVRTLVAVQLGAALLAAESAKRSLS
ncbi:M14 family zinc carboxypeptidase [Streptosporangium carneum]|uniref:Zinc carboxypeptidase n=1 Tax=Streptosporangium carneum TaxID=47481 RepID=A0A9W6HZV2_9ACTN|nr:M14 family zinc carboxypeptidase [Streptosporangium carneum]GLK09361.1 zinc carboxypeptidase [Streptosporangium carneum]